MTEQDFTNYKIQGMAILENIKALEEKHLKECGKAPACMVLGKELIRPFLAMASKSYEEFCSLVDDAENKKFGKFLGTLSGMSVYFSTEDPKCLDVLA